MFKFNRVIIGVLGAAPLGIAGGGGDYAEDFLADDSSLEDEDLVRSTKPCARTSAARTRS